MTSEPDQPTPTEVAAYLRGALPPDRFAAVDRWLEQLPEEEATRILGMAEETIPPVRLDMPILEISENYCSELPRSRLRREDILGEGGMAIVAQATDRSLERVVALKMLKPRQISESLEQYHLREYAFRREAALTAALIHPAIPPVYDIGRADGRPAFTMQRLVGRTLADTLPDTPVPALGLITPLLQVVEAIAFAHSRGIVHRDLTPANILIGEFGAVYVLDWGIAAHVGEGAGTCIGTPAWMAPEQIMGTPADPRMDVFALGGLLHLVLTGHGPRPDVTRPGFLDLTGLEDRRVPRGLAAVVRQCLAEPAHRYASAEAIAAELHRWLDDGITMAQQTTRIERMWLQLRRSRRARAISLALLAVLVTAMAAWWLHHRDDLRMTTQRLAEIATSVDMRQADAVRLARVEVASIRVAHPHLADAVALEERLRTASDFLAQQTRLAHQRATLEALLHRTREVGPWAGDEADWLTALAAVGIPLSGAQPEPWHDHPLATEIAEALAWAWRSAAGHGDAAVANRAAGTLAANGPGPAWRALGRICATSRFLAHDPAFSDGPDGTMVLADPACAGVAMAVFAPDPTLDARAVAVLHDHPGAFWPLIAAGRAALKAGDAHTAQHLGLVASGAEPGSIYPQLLLAYAALVRGDDQDLAEAVARGLPCSPEHGELLGLRAVVLAHRGDRAGAQRIIDRLGAGHLQFHLQHRVGHPMERTVDALVQAHLVIPVGAPDLPPLVPGSQRDAGLKAP